MYVLSVSVNGEITRSDAFASVIDAATDYADAIGSNVADIDHYADALTIVSGGFTGQQWDVPNLASDAGEGPTDSDTLTVSLQWSTSADVETDGIPVTYSRAVRAYSTDLVVVPAA